MVNEQDYEKTKNDYMRAADWLLLTYDEFENCIEYFRKAEERIAPYVERELLLENIKQLRKEVEEMEDRVHRIYLSALKIDFFRRCKPHWASHVGSRNGACRKSSKSCWVAVSGSRGDVPKSATVKIKIVKSPRH